MAMFHRRCRDSRHAIYFLLPMHHLQYTAIISDLPVKSALNVYKR